MIERVRHPSHLFVILCLVHHHREKDWATTYTGVVRAPLVCDPKVCRQEVGVVATVLVWRKWLPTVGLLGRIFRSSDRVRCLSLIGRIYLYL